MNLPARLLTVALASFSALATTAFSQTPLQPLKASAPEAVGKSVRDLLSGEAYDALVAGTKTARFWFRKELPAGGSGTAPLGVNFTRLTSAELLGVVEFEADWTDYKDKPVPAGVYTLRYAIQPADGNHTGVSPYRDYLLLLPAKQDQDASMNLDDAQLYKVSAEASGTNHPAVMALFPIWDEVERTSMVENELGQATLAFKIGDQTLGLVIEGHGEM